MSITIVGCGPGARACLTLEAVDTVNRADVMVGAPRVLDLFPESRAERVLLRNNLEEVMRLIETYRHGSAVSVLVTGDPGIHSLAKRIVERFGAACCRVIPGISSVQLAAARLGLDLAETRILSAHHRLPDVDPARLEGFETIAVLTGHAGSHAWIQSLAEALTGAYRIVLLENLSLKDERIEEVDIETLADRKPARLGLAILTRRKRP